jgi:hypothetical protein
MTQYLLQTSIRGIASVEGWNAPQFFQLKLRQALPGNYDNPEIKWIDRSIASENFSHFLLLLSRQINAENHQCRSEFSCIPILVSDGGFSFHYVVAIDCPERLSLSKFRRYTQQCWIATDWGYGELLIRRGGVLGWNDYIADSSRRNDLFDIIDLANYQNNL